MTRSTLTFPSSFTSKRSVRRFTSDSLSSQPARLSTRPNSAVPSRPLPLVSKSSSRRRRLLGCTWWRLSSDRRRWATWRWFGSRTKTTRSAYVTAPSPSRSMHAKSWCSCSADKRNLSALRPMLRSLSEMRTLRRWSKCLKHLRSLPGIHHWKRFLIRCRSFSSWRRSPPCPASRAGRRAASPGTPRPWGSSPGSGFPAPSRPPPIGSRAARPGCRAAAGG